MREALSASAVTRLVEQQLASIRDPAVLNLVQSLRVEPYPVERDWAYGTPGQTYSCWTVLEHPPSNTGVAYCDSGFGPTNPWGLVFLGGPNMNMGMSDAWLDSLEGAVRESMAWDGENK